MKVTRMDVIANGITGRCPNCGQRTLFHEGRYFKVNKACPVCGLKIENGDGAFLGPLVINYGVTVFGIIIPVVLLYASGRLGAGAVLAIALVVGLAVPLLLYRLSWGWWLMLYYFFLPDNLPANLDGRAKDDG
jgi:uncharacterized protein (DUF983 family)